MSALNMTDLYRGNDEEEGAGDGIRRVANPLHSAAMNQLRDENAQLHGHTVELRGQVARLEERLRREGITVDDKDGAEVEESPTAVVSVRQQDTLDADETDVPTAATEDVSSRLAGFGQISGKNKSLDRKRNRPPQKASMTDQTGAKDESEEGSVDL